MTAPSARAAWLAAACSALAGCFGNADRGRVAARLAPVALTGWLAADEGWRSRFAVADPGPSADAMVLARAGATRRLARLLAVPAESATRVPAGVRELRFWCTEPVAAAEPPAGCRVELEATWDAGAPAQVVSAPARRDGGSGWMSFRLVATPQREASILRLRVRASAACSGVPIAVAQSEVTPIVPAVLQKRPDLVLVAMGGIDAGELDCAERSRRAWPRVHNRWCVRGTRFADALASAADPRAGLDALLSGEAPGRAAAAEPLAALLQAQGYATFGVVPEDLRGAAWRGFDSLVEVPAGAPLATVRAAVARTLSFLSEQPLEPFFVALALPPLPDGAGPEVDPELDRVIGQLVHSGLEGRTAFVVAGATGRPLGGDSGGGLAAALSEDHLRVPLVVVPPARGGAPPAVTRTSELAASIDVFATALGLTGTPVPPGSSSRDLTWALDGQHGLGRPFVTSIGCAASGGCGVVVTTPELRVVREGDDVRSSGRPGRASTHAAAATEEALARAAAAAAAAEVSRRP